jgi:hypothetical protein
MKCIFLIGCMALTGFTAPAFAYDERKMDCVFSVQTDRGQVCIKPDAEIQYDKGVTPSEASKAIYKELADLFRRQGMCTFEDARMESP